MGSVLDGQTLTTKTKKLSSINSKILKMNFNFSKQNYLSVGDGWLDGSKSLSGILGSRNTLSLCEQSEQGGSKFTERKNPYTAVYGEINFDPNYGWG